MNVLKIFKWLAIGTIGFLAVAFAIFWIYFTINPVKPPDHFHGVKPDMQGGFTDEVIGYVQSSQFLGETPYKARLFTYRKRSSISESWDYFSCGIAKKYLDKHYGERSVSFFDRWFPAREIPRELWTKDITEVVKYDELNRIAVFDLGFTNFTCQLPPPD